MSGPKSVYEYSVIGIELGPISASSQFKEFYIIMETISTIRAEE